MAYGGLYLGRTSIMVEYLFKDICFLVVFICCSITLYPFLDRICNCMEDCFKSRKDEDNVKDE